LNGTFSAPKLLAGTHAVPQAFVLFQIEILPNLMHEKTN